GPESSDDGNDQHVERKGPEDIDDGGDNPVDNAAEIASNGPCYGTDRKWQQDANHRDLEVDLSGEQHSGHYVAAEIVRTEPMHRIGRLERAAEIDLERIERYEQRCSPDRDEQDREHC